MEQEEKTTVSESLSEVEDREPVLEDTTWTEVEEKRLRSKVDRLLMPLLMLAYFVLALDRGMEFRCSRNY